ncbi:MAG TPA: SRPBCC domain-containing protein [Sporichthya sp.]|nr:SRPBCC domain-containing protein [Sporichthya sp.]
MPVTNVVTDAGARTMTLTAQFDASVERTWQLYADPRRLEKWWGGGPGAPITIVDHDLSAGGWVRAQLITPEGRKVHAYWRILAVDAPHRLEWEDGMLDDRGEPSTDFPPTSTRMRLTERDGGGTVMTIVVGFPSAEAMQFYLDMALEAEMSQYVERADALLAELS